MRHTYRWRRRKWQRFQAFSVSKLKSHALNYYYYVVVLIVLILFFFSFFVLHVLVLRVLINLHKQRAFFRAPKRSTFSFANVNTHRIYSFIYIYLCFCLLFPCIISLISCAIVLFSVLMDVKRLINHSSQFTLHFCVCVHVFILLLLIVLQKNAWIISTRCSTTLLCSHSCMCIL